MQPPIATETILQNRYRLLSILGQGGFGRTYLAEDQGRFNEPCALKELIPPHESDYVLEKSKELFQREAATLYQIQHPQVPQFRATFEENERLFLVQDYVAGKTYRTLLDERKAAGATFSETEVWQFLLQLLPVLVHIHVKGIIHRDISPDNIIWRESDNLPVLIDFGVVKELATKFQLSPTATPVTTVGKPGYAPSEQIQTGRSYPNSDLYSLAVTCIVLLTGKEPQELFDDIQLSWQWQKWVSVNDGFAQVLNRMLSYRPGDRFQSAGEVIQALKLLTNPNPNPQPPIANPQPPTRNPQPPDNQVSQMRTIAVGRPPEPIASNYRRYSRQEPVISEPRSSFWDDPWAIIPVGIGLAILAGFGSWALVSTILHSRSSSPVATPPTVFPTEIPTPSETPTPTPAASPSNYSQKLDISTGGTISKEGTLKENATVNYIISAQQGQQLDASLSDEGVLMTILGPDQNPIDNSARRVRGWKGTLPYSGDYQIQLKPIKGLDDSNYQLNISLSEVLAPSPTPTATPTLTPVPSPSESLSSVGSDVGAEAINFPAGQNTARVPGLITSPQQSKRYLVNAQQGQIMSVNLGQSSATLEIRAPNGQPLENASGVLAWNGQLPSDGQYQIEVSASDPTTFNLDVSIGNQ
ncbi:MAG TPA: serine/threonine-protein kinase [Oculatellaceae cyanobacterium]|jgi:serine/threonine-protein kinase